MQPLQSLPNVPASKRPKPLYVRHNLSEEDQALVEEKGWKPVDVRLIENRADAVRATLEGVRVGTITMDKDEVNHLTLEARICGLLSTKGDKSGKKEDFIEKETMNEILDLNMARVNKDSLKRLKEVYNNNRKNEQSTINARKARQAQLKAEREEQRLINEANAAKKAAKEAKAAAKKNKKVN